MSLSRMACTLADRNGNDAWSTFCPGSHRPSEYERPHKATRESLNRPVLLTSRSPQTNREMKLPLSRERMNYTGSLAMSDWFSTAMGVVGNCRHLAHIQCWQTPTTSAQSFIVSPRNNTLSAPQKFFPPQVTVEKWKIFFRVERLFPISNTLQRSNQPQENFPLSTFLEICEVPNLSMKSNSVAQKLTVTQRQR